MPEVQEVFRMATQKVRPEPGALERQSQGQRRQSARRKARAMALAATLTVVTAVVAVQVARDTGGAKPKPASGGHQTPDAIVKLSGSPSGMLEAGGAIWVSTYEGEVYRIDPSTNRIIDVIYTGPSTCGDLVAAAGSVWVSGCGYWPPGQTVQIDAATGKILGRWGVISPVFGGGRAWAFDAGAPARDGAEVDPDSGRVTHVLPGPPLGYAFGSLWFEVAGTNDASRILRADPDTGAELASHTLPPGWTAHAIHGKIGGFASAGGYVWLTTYRGDPYGPHVTDGALYRIDPTSRDIEQMLSITLDPTMSGRDASGPGPEVYLDATGGIVWVAEAPDTVVGIDAKTGEIVGSYRAPGGGATNVEATADAVWIANFGDDSVWRFNLDSTG